MRLFGDILPFIGFKAERTTPASREFYGLFPHVREIETFQVGWLGIYFVMPLIKAEQVQDITD